MSPMRAAIKPAGKRFPRVSGDEPDMTMNTVARLEFSPRERG